MNDMTNFNNSKQKKSRHQPLSSFGAELMAVLRKASLEEIKLEFDTYALATRFQMRVYQLRIAMRNENHPDYIVASKVTTQLLWGKKANRSEPLVVKISKKNVTHPVDPCPTTLRLYPRDSEFQKALASANIDMPLPQPLEVNIPDENASSIEDFLSSLDDMIGGKNNGRN